MKLDANYLFIHYIEVSLSGIMSYVIIMANVNKIFWHDYSHANTFTRNNFCLVNTGNNSLKPSEIRLVVATRRTKKRLYRETFENFTEKRMRE